MMWAALLRGIGPSDPRMRNDNLRSVCLDLGFENVDTVLSSGNIIFETPVDDHEALEGTLEAAWPERLGFDSLTVVRSHGELAEMLERAPFGELHHGGEHYLLATFFKESVEIERPLPYRPTAGPFEVVAATDREFYTVSDPTVQRAPDVMTWLQRAYGKRLTSRTWLTVQRIVRRMEPTD